MGAYKDANGKTRVGKALSSVGGFFKGIFSKKSTSTSTTNNGAYASVLTGVDIPSLSNAIKSNNTTPTSGSAGKTKVGSILSSIGGFFKGIFATNNSSGNSNSSNNTTPTTGGATPGINGNSSTSSEGSSGGGWFSTVLVSVGLPALTVWLKSKGILSGTDANGNPTNSGTDANGNPINSGTDANGNNMSSPNTGLVIGIILVILAIASFFIFRKKK